MNLQGLLVCAHLARGELARLERGGPERVAHHVLAAPTWKEHAVPGFELQALTKHVDVCRAPVHDVHAGVAAPVDVHAPRRGELQALQDRPLEPNEARDGPLVNAAAHERLGRSYPRTRRSDLAGAGSASDARFMSDPCLGHVLVMGGTSGIGRAVTLRLAAGGARVSAVGRSQERGAEVERAARDHGGEVRFFAADLSVPGAAADVLDRSVSAFGPLDGAVNAAAGVVIQGPKRLHELDEGAFDRELVAEARICIESMRAQLAHAVAHPGRRTSIVNVGSINGLGASPRAPLYSAVKAAQLALTKNAALDYAVDGVRVNAVVLGAFDTPMLSQVYGLMSGGDPALAKVMLERFLGLVPLGRVGTAEEAATVIAWLCSPDSSYVTGASWIVDGGLTAFAR